MNPKLVTANDLSKWADQIDSHSFWPEILYRLIYFSTNGKARITLPTGDAISMPGWDAIIETSSQILSIQPTISLWEFGTDKDIKGKADSDFEKRVKKTREQNPAEATFVFVTPRKWTNADKWVQEKRKLAIWKNVVVITAIELEAWISHHRSIGLLLADHLGLIHERNVELPETYWKRFSVGKKYQLTPALLLGGRTAVVEQIKQSAEIPQVLYLQSHSYEETFAFVVASLIEHKIYNSIIAEDKNEVRALLNHYEHCIIITSSIDNWIDVQEQGNSVICIVSPEDNIQGAISLDIIERESFIKELREMGLDERMAERYAKAAGRAILPLKRMLDIPQQTPEWAKGDKIYDLMPFILAGKWCEDSIKDKSIIAILAGKPYQDIENNLRISVEGKESPFIHIGTNWKLRSAMDAIQYARQYITSNIQERLKKAIDVILTEQNPYRGEQIEYHTPENEALKSSTIIKEGLLQTLVLLASLTKETNQTIGQDYVNQILEPHFHNCTPDLFLDWQPLCPLLAEASPNIFIKMVQRDIKNGAVCIQPLLIPHQTLWYGNLHQASHLLWALESLAWDEKYLYIVSHILLQLAQLDQSTNNGNTPQNTLHCIFRLFRPQTYVSAENRYLILKRLAKKYPQEIFRLCADIIRDAFLGGAINSTHHYELRYIDNSYISDLQSITLEDCQSMFLLLMSIEEHNDDSHCKLLDIATWPILPEMQNQVWEKIKQQQDKYIGNDTIIAHLRHILHIHNTSKHKNLECKPFVQLLHDIMPNDIIEQTKWLFEEAWLKMLDHRKIEMGSEEEAKIRIKAVKKVLKKEGVEGLIILCNSVQKPEILGNTIALLPENHWKDWLIAQYMNATIPVGVVYGFYSQLLACLSADDFLNEIVILPDERSKVDVLSHIRCMPFIQKYVDDTLSSQAQSDYWRQMAVWGILDQQYPSVIQRLLDAQRFNEAIRLMRIGMARTSVTDEFVFDGLKQFVRTHRNENMPDGYELRQLVYHLDKSASTYVQENIVTLEFQLSIYLYDDAKFQHIQLVKAILHDPKLMMELIEYRFLPDGESKVDWHNNHSDIEKMLADISYLILHDLKGQPCEDENGKVNEEDLHVYIQTLFQLAKERKRVRGTRQMIAQLMGNIQFDEQYPPEYLCEIIEEQDSDEFDETFYAQLANRLSFTVRSAFDGGKIEQEAAEQYRQFAQKANLYPRAATIFSKLAEKFDKRGIKEDNEVEWMKAEY